MTTPGSTWVLERESKEWVGEVHVSVDGTEVADFELAVTDERSRPTIWQQPDVLEGKPGIYVGPGTARELDLGVHDVWARVTRPAETPVFKVGSIRVR